VVHGLLGRVRVVDRRRRHPQADVDELADAERRVLLERALESDPHPPSAIVAAASGWDRT
jgi:hypothetical protein